MAINRGVERRIVLVNEKRMNEKMPHLHILCLYFIVNIMQPLCATYVA
jgi:hypothetical protein